MGKDKQGRVLECEERQSRGTNWAALSWAPGFGEAYCEDLDGAVVFKGEP